MSIALSRRAGHARSTAGDSGRAQRRATERSAGARLPLERSAQQAGARQRADLPQAEALRTAGPFRPTGAAPSARTEAARSRGRREPDTHDSQGTVGAPGGPGSADRALGRLGIRRSKPVPELHACHNFGSEQ